MSDSPRRTGQSSIPLPSTHLWDEQQPRELPGHASWQPLPPDSVAALTELTRQLHPDLQKSRAKLTQFGTERCLLANKLLPQLTLDYNLLQAGTPFGPETGASLGRRR